MRFTRNEIWRHNGLLGSAAMAYRFVINVQTSPTTTDVSRNLAREVEEILGDLTFSLKTRRDQVQ